MTRTKIDPLAIKADETPRAYVARLLQDGSETAVATLEDYTKQSDNDATLSAFDNSVNVSWLVGMSLKARATITNNGTTPTKPAEMMAKVGVTEREGTYIARAYKALSECILIATYDNEVHRAAFVQSWFDAAGTYPTQVRQYAAWCRDASKSGKAKDNATVATLIRRRNAAATAAANAAAKAEERANKVTAIKAAAAKVTAPTGKPVAGCPLTKAQVDAMSADACDAAAIYFASQAKAKSDAIKAADAASKLAQAAAETGPAAKAPKRGAKAVA